MRTSTPWANRAFAFVALTFATGALAQDSARQKVEAQGGPAMERVKDAVARSKNTDLGSRSPPLPRLPDAGSRRRAFDRLKARVQSPMMEKRAKEAIAAGEAAMAARREEMAKRLRAALGLTPAETTAVAKAPAKAPSTWVPVLFVSASMPLPVLRAYAAQAERAGGVLAFRGLPGGMRKVGPMARLSAQMLRLDPGCEGPACAMRDVQVIVDPLLFRQHAVSRVPALAMVPGDPAQPYCEREETSPVSRFLVYGDAALSGLLEEYARLGGAREVRDAQAQLARR